MTYISSEEIGKRIRELRESRNMTQEGLGAILGVKKAAVQKIEAGVTNIRADKIGILCETFKVLPSALLFDSFKELWNRTFKMEISNNISYPADVKTLEAVNTLLEKRFGPNALFLIYSVVYLNETGIARAISYVSDIARIDDYRKDDLPE